MKLIDLDAEKDYLLDGKYKVKAGTDYVPIDEEWERGYTAGQMAEEKELVRCKDCKHLYKDGECPLRTWWTHTEDDYCSYGERKDDEQVDTFDTSDGNNGDV